jgi:hypothetical protein
VTAAGPEPEIRLAGGNVGGAVLAGGTVRRTTGPWTPAVHTLLAYLDGRVPCVPRVLGTDEQGREVLTYLPGRVIDTDSERLSPAQLTGLARWTRRFHEAVAGFGHPGPWRYFPVDQPTLICHNDIAPYNVCFDGDQVAGVFDWDLAGPSTPRHELAFMAWNCVPLWEDIGAAAAARRLELLAGGYGGIGAAEVLRAVPDRIQRMLDFIPAAAAAGDGGMANLLTRGEPDISRRALDGLLARIPLIARELRP